MKRKYLIIALALITIVGSLFMALGSNMFFDDIFNIAVEISHSTLFVSLPAMSVAIFFVMAVLYILRAYKHPNCIKRLSRLYAIILMVISLIGIIGAVLAGVNVYGTFVGSHPFPGYLIIFMILNIILLAGGVVGFVFSRKIKEDTDKVKINFLYVLKTIGWFLFICLVFNRFGMLLGAPTYIYLRNLYQTFPFYIYLLVPLFLGVLEVMFILKLLDKKKLFVLGIVGIAVNVVLFAYIAIMGVNDTAFISSLSQAMPLERMASKPLEILIHVLSYAGVGAAIMVQSKKVKDEPQPQEALVKEEEPTENPE